ncbi:MAG: DNRLRE domain-containing protein [Ignavibacteria bacterium]|nr:DNRLRE domain-containing protein [Ignavibacteria bacterium]
MLYKKLSVLLFAGLFFHAAFAGETILQNGFNGYSGCADAYVGTNTWGTIVGFFPNQNYGTATELKIFRESCCSFPTARTVIRFDLSSIPQNAVVEKAVLSVYAFENGRQLGTAGAPNNTAKSIYLLTEPWQDNTVTWKNQPAFDSTALAQNTNTKVKTWEEFDVTSAVRGMVQSKVENFGFMIKFPAETDFLGAVIYSSECSITEYRPKLMITYTVDSALSEYQAKALSTDENRIIKTDANSNKK